jgi:hypothetical protein
MLLANLFVLRPRKELFFCLKGGVQYKSLLSKVRLEGVLTIARRSHLCVRPFELLRAKVEYVAAAAAPRNVHNLSGRPDGLSRRQSTLCRIR